MTVKTPTTEDLTPQQPADSEEISCLGAGVEPPAAEVVTPLQSAKTEVNAAIDVLLLQEATGVVSRVGVAQLRDAIDKLRLAIPKQRSARSRTARAVGADDDE